MSQKAAKLQPWVSANLRRASAPLPITPTKPRFNFSEGDLLAAGVASPRTCGLATSSAPVVAAEVVRNRRREKPLAIMRFPLKKGRKRYFTGSNEGCYPSDTRAAWSLQ